MGALTYIALLVIDGDEAYAGIISDVPSSPGDSNPCPSLIKQPQGVAGGVAHRFQLLLLAFINYCGEKKKKKEKKKIRQSLSSQNVKYGNAAVKLIIPS